MKLNTVPHVIRLFAFIAILFSLLTSCNNDNDANAEATPASKYGVPLPDPGISGYLFPEKEATINQWLASNDSMNINLHGWGLWTSLTMASGKYVGSRELLVYQTWLSPSQLINKMQKVSSLAVDTVHEPALLEEPHQFKVSKKLAAKRAFINAAAGSGPTSSDTFGIKVNVSYSPDAATYSIDNRIFYKSVLDSIVNAGQKQIPDFPSTAVTLKPVYKLIRQQALINGKYYVLPVWPGTPAIDTIPFDETSWNNYVYVDVTNSSSNTGHVIKPGEAPGPGNAYNLSDFINYKIDNRNKAALKAGDNDYLILVAMHVTSREITRWTWQTFWWDPTPSIAEAPSSPGVVTAKPPQLKGAPAHYAMSIAYTFIQPDQPLTGGNNIGTSIYAFNPYLEAGFDQSTFINGGLATVITNGITIKNNVGMRTNCMSCHALATFNKNDYNFNNGIPYIGNTYIDMVKDSIRSKYLALDFAWSIQGNIDPNK